MRMFARVCCVGVVWRMECELWSEWRCLDNGDGGCVGGELTPAIPRNNTFKRRSRGRCSPACSHQRSPLQTVGLWKPTLRSRWSPGNPSPLTYAIMVCEKKIIVPPHGSSPHMQNTDMTGSDLEKQIEYDLDTEDMKFLRELNASKKVLTEDALEYLIDRLEKLKRRPKVGLTFWVTMRCC